MSQLAPAAPAAPAARGAVWGFEEALKPGSSGGQARLCLSLCTLHNFLTLRH